MPSTAEILSFLALILSIGIGVYAYIRERDRAPAQNVLDMSKAAREFVETGQTLVNSLKQRIDELEKEMKKEDEKNQAQIKKLEETLAEYSRGVEILLKQMRKKGITPAWEPSHMAEKSAGMDA